MTGRDPLCRPPSPPRCGDEAGTCGVTGARSSGGETQARDRDHDSLRSGICGSRFRFLSVYLLCFFK